MKPLIPADTGCHVPVLSATPDNGFTGFTGFTFSAALSGFLCIATGVHTLPVPGQYHVYAGWMYGASGQ